MNAELSLQLARRFIELPKEKRRLFLDGLQQEGVDFSLLPIPADVASADRDGLSYAQQRMWFLWQLDPLSAAYNLPMAVRLKGALDIAALHEAFNRLVARHETLRTLFHEDDGQVRQQVLEALAVGIQRHDLSAMQPDEREAQVTRIAEAEACEPFDLVQGPLLRVQLLALAAEEHVLLLTLHHIVADGWSLNVLIEEFLRLYDAACSASVAALGALPVQYRDYALWQRSWLEAGEQDRQLAYWRAQLGDEHTPLDLPLDRQRPALPSYRGARLPCPIDGALAEGLRGLAKAQGVTLFMVLLASFKVLLQRYSGQDVIRVGVPVANRNRGEVEGLIGCFINTQVLHTEIDPLSDVHQLLDRIKATALGAQAHQELPFERLVEALALDRSAHAPLFQVLFNHQAAVADAGQIRTQSGLTLEKLAQARHSARFDLALDTYESAGQLHAVFNYALDLFEGDTIAAMSEQWLQVLRAMVATPHRRVAELASSLGEVIGDAPIVREAVSIHALIERAAARHPQQLAGVSAGRTLTYATLQARSDALAQVLLDNGAQPDQRIGVLADRSIDMLVAIVAVLKAGAAYLPLEPDQPAQRLAFMLADSQVRLVLGRDIELPGDVRLIAFDLDWPAATLAPVAMHAEQLAYVIYTSGTTGMPKGVAVSHGALLNYVLGIGERLPLEAVRSLAMVTTPAADLGHTLLFGALCGGKTLHLLDKRQVLDADAFATYMREHAIDALKIVPAHLQAMLSAGAAALPRRVLILGGEAVAPALLQRVTALAPVLRVINHYGPTETTVGVLTHELAGAPLLGRALANIRVQVLSDGVQPVPAAARGELYISGAGLARGYLGKPGLTAQRFVPDPASAHGERMYRSGDWVRRQRDGALAFIGRRDGQIKIRGYRVELGEIESRLAELPGVAAAVVKQVGEGEHRQLAAWLVPTIWAPEQAAQLAFIERVRAGLEPLLADYLQPQHWLALERLPVTANGKLDSKALPPPVAAVARYCAPETELQMQVAAIWAQVLQVERVGLEDNFFALGGHSLLATQVVSRIRHQLQREVALRVVFDTRDLRGFSAVLQGAEQATLPVIPRLDRTQPLRLSHAQHRQWLFWKLNPQSTAYNTPLAVKLQGALDVQALQSALNALVARHESLRTVFDEQDGQTWQRVLPVAAVPVDRVDLSATPDALHAHLERAASHRFDLAQGPLLRVTLFKIAAEEHVLAVVLHHIVSDGWSMSLMVREFAAAYNALVDGSLLEMPPLPVQYADYAGWQHQCLAEGQLQAQSTYWREKLEADFDVLELPADRPRPSVQSYQGGRIDLRLPADLAQRLRHLAVAANATLFHVFLTAFALVLTRYSGKEKINVGVPVTNRNRLELEGLIGFFVNTLVVRVAVDPAATFAQLLETVRDTTLEAQANKDMPFDVLVEALKPERGLGHNPLFQVMYNHLRDVGDQVSTGSLHGLRVEEIDLAEHSAQFDLSLDTLERSDGVMASFGYACDLFDAERIQRLAGHWFNVLQAIGQAPNLRVVDVPMLGAEEHQQMVGDWNRSEVRYSGERCIHRLIEIQAERTPTAIALVFGEHELTYQALNDKANQLAHKLRELGVGADTRVGVAVERGLELIVGLLAILKAGGAYVPLDPEYPQDRLSYMIEDSGIPLLLTQSHLLTQLAIPAAVRCLLLERDGDWLDGYSTANPRNLTHPDNLAYVMYTSGSTGRPKGVAISHDALSKHAQVSLGFFGLGSEDCILQFATFNFDGFVEQLYPALICGARVVIRGKELWDSETFYRELLTQDISVVDLTTAYWFMLAKDFANHGPRSYGRLRQVHAGGEAMAPEGVAAWKQAGLGHVRLLNTYGPTEATVTVSTHDCAAYLSGAEALPTLMPIGTVLPGRTIYLLDNQGNLTVQGAIGELTIGGDLLARGYFNRPALTAERFIPDPFDRSEQGGGRLYRSGDLTRHCAAGVIEYVGRIDHQVKIRGFRIELGEIEAKLQEHAGVRETLVVDIEGASGKQLVAYLVTADLERQDALRTELREHLTSHLPDYMIPAHWMFLAAMPLTPNGKVDRKALPKPDATPLQHQYVAPRSALEQQVGAIWAEVLKIDQVGLNDHFFELGGHSLLATQLISRVRQRLAIELPLRSLFEAPTLAAFVQLAEQSGGVTGPAFERVSRQAPVPLSYAQQRQWFLWQLEPTSAAYHIPAVLRLQGRLNVSALQRSFDALIARHEPLRTTFREEEGQALQVIHGQLPCWLTLEDVKAFDEQALQARIETDIRRPFDLEKGPLLRITLLQRSEDEHVLVLTQHHIVTDAWSMPVMVDELLAFYAAFSRGHEIEMPPLPFQYADHARWQRRWMDGGERQRQTDYWLAQLGGEQPVLQLPTDRPRPAVRRDAGARHGVVVDQVLLASLKRLAQRHQATLFMVLLASLQSVLHRYSGQEDIRVGVAVANRTRLETERLIGFFVNTQVMKAEFDPSTTFASLLAQVKQHALQAQAHQDLPFEQLVEYLQPERSQSHSPLFQVMFNHQAQGPGAMRSVPGLTLEDWPREQRTSQFDLTLDTCEDDARLLASWTYATDLFDADTIVRLSGHWLTLLQSIVAQPQQRIGDLPMLGADERQRILRDWNARPCTYLADTCLHAAIERQVRNAPHATALLFGAEQLSYAQLNRHANRLAHRLRELGVAPDVRVGVALERGLEMVVCLLAILKAGGAYVPLDPDYPQDRLAYQLEDSGIRLLLTQASVRSRLPALHSLQVLELGAAQDWFSAHSETDLHTGVAAQNLAYVIYTSGSTGKPKGTLLSHHNVMRLFQSTQAWFSFDASDVWSVFHSYAFDFSVWELFGALVSGAKALIVPKDVARAPEDFHALLASAKVTVLNQTPSAFRQLIPVATAAPQALALRYVIFGGEALDVKSLAPWFERFGDHQPRLINMYGITETTVHVSYRPITLADLQGNIVSPLGEVIADLSWYLLSPDLDPVGPGCHGELHVGRAGLARGYHHRPGLTAERFIPDPFDSSEAGGGRLYRTGDLARYRNDRAIEYSGRIDQQVKVRGFRIELGEIEACLQAHAAVGTAVVLAQEGPAGTQLVAYIVPVDAKVLHSAERQAAVRETLRATLKRNLPDYMVPAHLLLLGALPLTANGKLDRKALPPAEAGLPEQAYVAPRTAFEQQVAAIWAQLLKLERVGLADNFFESGGHSLLATQVVGRLRPLAPQVRLRDLFDQPRLDGFCALLVERGGVPEQPSQALNPRGAKTTAPLSLAQRRLWVIEQLTPGTAAYSMPMALRLHGELSVPLLSASLQALVARHEVLRTQYGQDEEGNPLALISATLTIDLPLEDLSALDAGTQQARVDAWVLDNERQPVDLEQAPLLRMRVLRLAPKTHVLLCCMHHIISDGWSMAVLARELVELYGRLRAGDDRPLPALPLQYSDFALWQHELERTGVLERQTRYWRDALQGYSGYLPLPLPQPRAPQRSHAGDCLSFDLSAALAASLSRVASDAGVTLYNLLLAAFHGFLHRLTGSQDVVVGIDYAGRQQPELEGLIGFFVNVLPVRSRARDGVRFAQLLTQVRDALLEAFEHQDLPFDMIVEAAQVPRHQGVGPLVQVLFVMNNVPGGVAGIDGLRVEPLASQADYAKFDMALFIEQTPDLALHGQWRYASALFTRTAMQRFVDGWVAILEQIVNDPNLTLEDMNMPVETQPVSAAPVGAAVRKANKLDTFLKKKPQALKAPLAATRESRLVPTQDFPLLLEPLDPALDIIQWIEGNRGYLEDKLARHGGILFRGFAIADSQAFEAFAEAIQPGLYGNYGDLPKKEGGQNTYRSTPYPEQKMILFHNESAHQDSWPRKQLFFCELPSPVGGATPVVDCRQMYERLPLALREKFEREGLLYVRTFTGKLDVTWQHFFKTDQRSEVEARCRASGIQWRWLADDALQIRTPSPAIITHPQTGARSFFNQVQLHHIHCLDADVREDLLAMFGLEGMPRNVYYGDGSPIEDEVMQLIGELYEACAVRFDWRQGDVILLDNMLVAHARDPFEGPRKIVVAMGDMFKRSSLAPLSADPVDACQEIEA